MAGPVGPITTPPGQYTHCVERGDYVSIPDSWWPTNVGIPSGLTFVLCEYLLGGKLVCLAGGGDECTIGTVVGIEEVGFGKTGFDAIDNDFSFNVLPIPYAVQDMAVFRTAPGAGGSPGYEPHNIRDNVKSHSPLGYLLADPSPSPTPLPTPLKPGGTSPVDGYGVGYRWRGGAGLVYDHGQQDNLHRVWEGNSNAQDGSLIVVPVLHCECEGSRIWFVCNALKPLLDIIRGSPPGSGLPSPGEVCHALLDWVPFGIGKTVCNVVEDIVGAVVALALAPLLLAAFGSAWEAAQVYDDLFVTGPVSRRVTTGETVIVLGRWAWDAGHAGHTELHPVKAFQRVELPPILSGGLDPTAVVAADVSTAAVDFRDRWCRLLREAPPPINPAHPDSVVNAILGSLTPEQTGVHVRQQEPGNDWILHPAIDGCAPEAAPPVIG